MTTDTIPVELSRKDFVSDQTVRWCPGCGDYAILAQMQKVLPDIGVPRENIVFISGIGCSSRFPYYMNTYGIHSIHGRAPTLATGLALANPDLSVWVITGDGDGLSIGGNHLIHALRRNVNLNIILFNNRIYGLTKGQYSPTSRMGHKTKSSPMGSIEQPINPVALALASEATFVARSIDAHTKHLADTLLQAAAHEGVSFVEVYQNCVIFNPHEWDGLADRRLRDDNLLYLEPGQPMVYGKNRDHGIRLNGFQPEVVELGNGVSESDVLVHDAASKQLAYILASMEYPEFPEPMGVIRQVEKPSYGQGLRDQIQEAQAKLGRGDLNAYYRAADLWTVEEREEVTGAMSGEVDQSLDDEYIDEIDQETPVHTAMEDLLKETPITALKPSRPIDVFASASLTKAVGRMNRHDIGCLLVTDEEDRLIGIFTERDVVMRVAGVVEDLDSVAVGEVMTLDPITVSADMPLAQAVHIMSLHSLRHLPIVNEDYRPVGIISFRDVARFVTRELS